MNTITLKSVKQLEKPIGVQNGDNEGLIKDQQIEVVEEWGDLSPKNGEQSKGG